MSPLRRRMIEDMTVRNLSPYTQRNYLFAVSRFVRHVRTSPADVGPEQLRDYLKHLVERKISSSYYWYLEATADLLSDIADAGETFMAGRAQP